MSQVIIQDLNHEIAIGPSCFIFIARDPEAFLSGDGCKIKQAHSQHNDDKICSLQSHINVLIQVTMFHYGAIIT
jgi:hypothetical protein